MSGEGTGTGTTRTEGEAALGLTRMGGIGSLLLVARSQPPTTPLKLTFNMRQSGG